MAEIIKNNTEKKSHNCNFSCTKNGGKKTICGPDCIKLRPEFDKSDKKFHFNSEEIKKIKKYFELSPIKEFKNYLLHLNMKIRLIIESDSEYNRIILDSKIRDIY